MSWTKTKIGDFLFERKGKYKPSDEAIQGLKRIEKIDFRGNFHIGDKSSKTNMILVKKGDLVISGINVAKGAMGIYDMKEDVVATIHYSSYTFDKEKINVGYFKRFLKSAEFIRLLNDQIKGGIKTEIKPKHILPLEINLPDIDTQNEIVSKFEIVEADIGKLNGEVSSQEKLLKKLQQSILQEAIEGKLTASWREQNTDVESASVLLEKIKSEKEKLVKDKKIKKQKPLPLISEDEIPFDIPDSWLWCRIGELIYDTSGGKSPKCENTPVEDEEWGVIKTTAIQDMFFNENKNKILPNGFDVLEHYIIHNGDLLITRAGPINRVGIVCEVKNLTKKLILSDKTIRMSHNKDFVSSSFLQYSLSNPIIKKLMENNMTGMADSQVNISQDNMKNFITILAPIEEQKVIVEKIETLFKICDELAEQINSSKTNSQTLIQAVLKEAFEG